MWSMVQLSVINPSKTSAQRCSGGAHLMCSRVTLWGTLPGLFFGMVLICILYNKTVTICITVSWVLWIILVNYRNLRGQWKSWVCSQWVRSARFVAGMWRVCPTLNCDASLILGSYSSFRSVVSGMCVFVRLQDIWFWEESSYYFLERNSYSSFFPAFSQHKT